MKELKEFTYKFGFSSVRKPILITLGIIICMFSYKLSNTMYLTNNFDSINRSEIKYSIQSDNAKMLKTTERQADSVNGVLGEIQNAKSEWGDDLPLMVYGSSVLFYYLSDSVAYVQPWINLNTYPMVQFTQDLVKAKEENELLPFVVYCKTNNYYGFHEEKLSVLSDAQMVNTDLGKKNVLADFLNKNAYECAYENDYYAVFVPNKDNVGDFGKIKSIIGLE